MKRQISVLDWMLAIDFDSPQLMNLAKRLEHSKVHVYSFIDTNVDYLPSRRIRKYADAS